MKDFNMKRHIEAFTAADLVLQKMSEEKTARSEVREFMVQNHRAGFMIGALSGIVWGLGTYSMCTIASRRFPKVRNYRSLVATAIGAMLAEPADSSQPRLVYDYTPFI